MFKSKTKKLFLASLVALMVAMVMAAYGFPSIIKRQIQKNIQIDNTSIAFKNWQKIPFPLHFKVYLFNVTNPEEVSKGERPKLQEVGPYCFDQYREKIVLGYGENDTIRYKLKAKFVFNQEMSGTLTQDDTVTVINLSYVALLLKVYELMPGVVPMVNEAMEHFFPSLEDPFLRVRVGDLLFDGVFLNCSGENTGLKLVCSRLRQQAPATLRPAEEDEEDGFYFSMFSHLNLTESGPFEMNRGTQDIRQLGHIVSYKGQTEMRMWRDEHCSKINGSDALFPPLDAPAAPERLYTFEPEVCRSMHAQLVGPTTMFNLTAYHYEVDRLSLACKSAVPGNKCFCQKNWSSKHDGCLMMGVQDLSPCQKVPVVASLPHFYLASEELLDYFQEGINPDRQRHNTYVYIEPTTGVVLKGVKRLQFNIELRQMAGVRQLAEVSTGLFPMLWVEEGAEVTADIVQLLRSTSATLGYVEAARWALLVAALVCCVWSATCVARGHHSCSARRHSVSFVMARNSSTFTEPRKSH